jgi:hypothetical protein
VADRPCTTPSCAIPTDAFVCRSCAGQLRADLRAVAKEIVDDLLDTIARLDRIGEPGPRASEIPLPYRPAPAEVARDLHAELATWVRYLGEARGNADWTPVAGAPLGPLPAARMPGDDTVELAWWLDRHLESVRYDVAGGELVDCVGNAVSRARWATDRSDSQYLGPCACSPDERGRPVELYARRGARVVRCRSCPAEFDVAARRGWLLAQAADCLLPAPEMSRALPGLAGQSLTPAMIHGYAHRGRLVPHGRNGLGRPLFRVGDVLDVLHQVAVAAL